MSEIFYIEQLISIDSNGARTYQRCSPTFLHKFAAKAYAFQNNIHIDNDFYLLSIDIVS